MLKLDEPFRNQEIFTISFFQIVQIWVLRVTFFFAIFGCYFPSWIRIGLQNRVAESGLKNQGLWQKLSSFFKQSELSCLHYYEV